jgi:hypothetical protein
MDTRGLEKPIVVAAIYLLFFCFSAAIAFILFKYIPGSEATAEGSIGDLSIKAGGAFAGFIISFIVLHQAYTKIILPKRLVITGNILDEHNSPVLDAVVTVDGVDRRKKTDDNGWFTIEVDRHQSQWTVRAEKANVFASDFITVNSSDIDKPVRITLKKKA